MYCEICGANGATENFELNLIEYKGVEKFLELRFTECLECDSDYADKYQVATNAQEMRNFKREVDG